MERKIELLMFSARFKKWYIRLYHVFSYLGLLFILGGVLLFNRLLFTEDLVDVFLVGTRVIISLMLTVLVVSVILDTKNKDFDQPLAVQSMRIMYTRIKKMMSEWKRNISSRFFWFLQVGNVLLLMRFILKKILWIFLYQTSFLMLRGFVATEIMALEYVMNGEDAFELVKNLEVSLLNALIFVVVFRVMIAVVVARKSNILNSVHLYLLFALLFLPDFEEVEQLSIFLTGTMMKTFVMFGITYCLVCGIYAIYLYFLKGKSLNLSAKDKVDLSCKEEWREGHQLLETCILEKDYVYVEGFSLSKGFVPEKYEGYSKDYLLEVYGTPFKDLRFVFRYKYSWIRVYYQL